MGMDAIDAMNAGKYDHLRDLAYPMPREDKCQPPKQSLDNLVYPSHWGATSLTFEDRKAFMEKIRNNTISLSREETEVPYKRPEDFFNQSEQNAYRLWEGNLTNLLYYCYIGDFKAVRDFFKKYPGFELNYSEWLSSADVYLTPLNCAVLSGNHALVEYLLVRGAHPDGKDLGEGTLLHYAKKHEGDGSAHKLILDTLWRFRNREFIRDYIYPGGYPKTTPLISAVEKGDVRIVHLLFKHGADIHYNPLNNGYTLLDLALKNENTEVAEYLIKQGAKLSKENSASLKQQRERQQKAFNYLLEGDYQSFSATLIRIESNRYYPSKTHCMRFSLFMTDKQGRTPIHLLFMHAKKSWPIGSFISYFKKLNGDFMALDNDKNTPLHYLAQNGNPDCFRDILFNNDIDLNIQNNDGETLLITALKHKNTAVAKFLIEKGVDLEKKDKKGRRAIHYAMENGDYEIVELLRSKNADFSKLIQDELQPDQKYIFTLIKQKDFETLSKTFKNKKIDFNFRDEYGQTPLHVACELGCEEIVKFLLTKKAELHAQDNDLNTPLHCAIRSGNAQLVAFLLGKGAKTSIKNKLNQTPYVVAWTLNKKDIIKLLEPQKITVVTRKTVKVKTTNSLEL